MRLDIVIPAHNEEARIDRTLRQYREQCPEPDVRFVVALDGCSDRTREIAGSHAIRDGRVEVLSFPKLGKGGVLMESLRRCDAEFVAFVDADGATPPAELLRLVEAARHADGAIGSRRHPAALVPRRRALARRLGTAGFLAWTRALFGLHYWDTQCGAKVLRQRVVAAVLPFLSSRDFLFDIDLLLVANRLGYRIVEVPTIWIDQDGSRLRVSCDARRMAVSALRLWLHHHVLPIEDPVRARAPCEPAPGAPEPGRTPGQPGPARHAGQAQILLTRA